MARFRETFKKKNNMLVVQVSRILLDEFHNGRTKAEETVSLEDAKNATIYGILNPVTISQDPEKRDDPVTGLPMVKIHDGARRTLMAQMAKENLFFGIKDSPLVIDGELCIPCIIDDAKLYEDRKEDLIRQLIKNSGKSWSDTDLIRASVEFVDECGGKDSEFAEARCIKRETVQRFLKIGRTEGLVEALEEGFIKNTSVAFTIATELSNNPTLSLERLLKEVSPTDTASSVEFKVKDLLYNLGEKQEVPNVSPTNNADPIQKPNLGETGLPEKKEVKASPKPEVSPSYSFCSELKKLEKLLSSNKNITLATKEILATLVKGCEEHQDAYEMQEEIKFIDQNPNYKTL